MSNTPTPEPVTRTFIDGLADATSVQRRSVPWRPLTPAMCYSVPSQTRYNGTVHDFVLLNAPTDTHTTRAAIAESIRFLKAIFSA